MVRRRVVTKLFNVLSYEIVFSGEKEYVTMFDKHSYCHCFSLDQNR